MSDSKEVELSLEVYINKEKTKVLFAEAGNDFADVLLSFLMLPLGKIVKIMEKQYGDNAPTIGSLTTLYSSLSKPNMVGLWTQLGKQVLNNPRSNARFSNLKASVDYTLPSTYKLGEPYNAIFTRNSASFLISDDLRMAPNLAQSIMETLRILGIDDITVMKGASIRNVTIGLKEVIDLLKGSLTSHTPLSDLILSTRQTELAGKKYGQPGILFHPGEEGASSNAEKMILKVIFQKSTKKLLFAQAKDDFVDFLFSMLNALLGRVAGLLGGSTCLSNIDNLNFLPPSDFNKADTQIYVEGSEMYMVTDDLTVTRLSLSSILSFLDQTKVSVADIEEVELQIGFQEASRILKASLTSTCALTDGLINSQLNKQPTQIQKILNKRQRDWELEEKERK